MFSLSTLQKRHNTNVLHFFSTADSKQTFSYAELHDQSIELSRNIQTILLNIDSCSTQSFQLFNIAILLPVHSPAILPAIVGIEHSGCVSCFLNPFKDFENLKKQLVGFRTNIILCDYNNFIKLTAVDKQFQQIFSCTLFDTECVFVKIIDLKYKSNEHFTLDDCDDLKKSSKICFYASTSGSCGEVKAIGITYKCFMPNITSLGDLYGVNENDKLFVSSPPSFDPFMVDVCLALHYGASLVMVDQKLRLDVKKMLDILFPVEHQSNITIMQMTPSLFMRWTLDDIKSRVFSPTSTLRILALGGESFPLSKTLRKWMNWEHEQTVRIFNLYGLTEMSCWAAAYEITKYDILDNRKIPIGQPIDEYTTFQVDDDSELVLKSTIRKCFQPKFTDSEIIDNTFEIMLHTGDLVYIENGAFYFTSRTNSTIKFYGQKINLADIEKCAKNVDNVEDVVCVHDENHNTVALFVKTRGDGNFMKTQITKALQTVSVHVKIYCVSDFPLTTHGKVSKYDLLNLTIVKNNGKKLQSIQSKFLELINESLGTAIQAVNTSQPNLSGKKAKMDCDLSFIQLGGSSLKAIQIFNELETLTSQSNAHLLTMLLDEQIPIRNILSNLNENFVEIQSQTVDQISNSDSIQIIPEIMPRWKINMDKCIDATPTVCILTNGEVIVSVGSHSKWLYNISIKSGEILSKLMLPDRIESQVVQMDDYGIVGCYDGHLYCFDIRTNVLKWHFDSGGMIKCRPLLIHTSVFFGNYNESHNFWHLNATDGMLKCCLKIGTKSIYANPVKLNDENCLVCSLDGTAVRINCLTAQIVWRFDSSAPIFSTPTVFQNNHQAIQIILAAVNGHVFGLNMDGDIVWSFQIDGNLFSTIEHFPSSKESCINLIFGSQNRYLYCHEIGLGKEISCVELWHILTSAPIRSNVVFIQNEPNLLAAIFSSDGVVQVINCDNGKLIRQKRINGDVFSTPIVHNGCLFVGSRNNFLYCIDLNDLTGNELFLDGS